MKDKIAELRPARAASRCAGFTLIEVLAAMIILAVGLMALQSLSIYAARSVTLAKRQGEYTLVASRHVEAAVDSLRRGVSVSCGTSTWPAGINTDVIKRTIVGAVGQRTVTVEVVPDAASEAVHPRNFQLRTNVFLPNATAAC